MSTRCFLYGVSYKQELTVFQDMFSNRFADMIINSMTKMRFIWSKKLGIEGRKLILQGRALIKQND